MISSFLFEKVPRFFAYVYRLICESAVFRFGGKVWHGLCGLFSRSLFAGALSERENEYERAGDNLAMRLIEGAAGGIVNLFRRVIGALTFGSYSCVFTRILARLRELYTFLDFEFFTGICLWIIILCPGEMWSNFYGLAISVVLLISLIILAAAGKREVLPMRILGAAFFAFVFSTLISILVASDRADAVRVFVFFATSFIMAVVIAASATDAKKLKKLLGFIYSAVILTSLYAFYQRVTGVELSASLTDLTQNVGMPGRVFSTFDNPNNYAEFLILTLPFCAAYCSMLKKSRTAVVAWLLNLLPFAALLMTYSRSGWISFAIAAVIFVFLYNKKLIPILVLAILAVIPLLPSSVLARMSTIGSTSDSSNMYRIYIWEGVLRMLREYWFSGIGLGPSNFRAIYLGVCNPLATPAPHSHMLFLEIWVEQGLLGILSYFGMLFSVIRRSLIALKYASGEVKAVLIAGVSALGGLTFACAAEYVWFYPRVMVTYFIVLGLLYACIGIIRKEREAQKTPEFSV